MVLLCSSTIAASREQLFSLQIEMRTLLPSSVPSCNDPVDAIIADALRGIVLLRGITRALLLVGAQHSHRQPVGAALEQGLVGPLKLLVGALHLARSLVPRRSRPPAPVYSSHSPSSLSSSYPPVLKSFFETPFAPSQYTLTVPMCRNMYHDHRKLRTPCTCRKLETPQLRNNRSLRLRHPGPGICMWCRCLCRKACETARQEVLCERGRWPHQIE